MSEKLVTPDGSPPATTPASIPNIDRAAGARILARSFYRELRENGYTPNTVVSGFGAVCGRWSPKNYSGGGGGHDDLYHDWNTQSSAQWDGFRHFAHRPVGRRRRSRRPPA